MSQYASPAPTSASAPVPRWQRILGVLIAFAGGITAGLMFTFGPSSGDSPVPSLILFYAVALAASLTGGALFRSRKGALVIAGAAMLGTIAYVAFNNVRYDLAHPNAGVGTFIGADFEVLAIILLWEGGPAWLFAVLGMMLRTSISRGLDRRRTVSQAGTQEQ
jgi:hypothetical protein